MRLGDPRLRRVLDSMDICQSVLASFFVRAAAGQYDLERPEQLVRLLVAIARNKVAYQARRQRAGSRDLRRDVGRRPAADDVAGAGPSPSRVAAGRELLDGGPPAADRRRSGGWPTSAPRGGPGPRSPPSWAARAQARRKQLARALDRVAGAAGPGGAAAMADPARGRPTRRRACGCSGGGRAARRPPVPRGRRRPRPAQLAAVLRVDQRERWRGGERVTARPTTSATSPRCGDDPEAAFEVIYGEFLLREELGEAPDAEEYLRRLSRASPTGCGCSSSCIGRSGRPTAGGSATMARPIRRGSRSLTARRADDASRSRCGAVPAATRSWASWAAAAWASSTRPGRSRLNRHRGPEDDPGRRPGRPRGAGPVPAEAEASPGCSTRTSCRSTRSASTTAGRSSRWSTSTGGSLADRLDGTPQPAATAAAAGRDAGPGHPPRPPAGDRPPRPEAGQRPASPPTARRKITDFGLAKLLRGVDARA